MTLLFGAKEFWPGQGAESIRIVAEGASEVFNYSSFGFGEIYLS
jgi:hypothetical protein